MLDLSHLGIVQTAGLLLPVTADERNGVAFFEQVDTILHLPVLHADFAGYALDVDLFHVVKKGSVLGNHLEFAPVD